MPSDSGSVSASVILQLLSFDRPMPNLRDTLSSVTPTLLMVSMYPVDPMKA